MKIYVYKNCDACRKAVKWLRARGLDFEELPIREQPPAKDELKRMCDAMGGDLRRLFNTSGRDYRELGLKERVPEMDFSEAADLLMGNGNLVKRPFLVGAGVCRLGFKESEWEQAFG